MDQFNQFKCGTYIRFKFNYNFTFKQVKFFLFESQMKRLKAAEGFQIFFTQQNIDWN